MAETGRPEHARARASHGAQTPPRATSACMRSVPGVEATGPSPPGRSRTLYAHHGILHAAAELLLAAVGGVDERPVNGDVGELVAPTPRARP